jgi:hypothetical protein
MTTRAYVLITTEVGKAIEVAEQLRQLPGVRAADVVTGTYDLVLVLGGATPATSAGWCSIRSTGRPGSRGPRR